MRKYWQSQLRLPKSRLFRRSEFWKLREMHGSSLKLMSIVRLWKSAKANRCVVSPACLTCASPKLLCLVNTPSDSNIVRYSFVLTVKTGTGFAQMIFGRGTAALCPIVCEQSGGILLAVAILLQSWQFLPDP